VPQNNRPSIAYVELKNLLTGCHCLTESLVSDWSKEGLINPFFPIHRCRHIRVGDPIDET